MVWGLSVCVFLGTLSLMSSWPPSPPPVEPSPSRQSSLGDREWQVLEKVLLASVEEQRRARRWSIFFRLITLGYVLLLAVALSRGCSSAADPKSAMGRAEPHLAVIKIDGEIGGNRGTSSADVIEALHDAFESKQSRAIVLDINSPGGSPVQSDDIWTAIRDLKAEHKDKKVYAVIGDLGASGAYYIASAADEIWVNRSSLVGSIGVIMPNYGVTELAKKLGIEDRTMTAGEHKAILSFTKPLDPYEKAHVQGVLDNVHQHFIAAVRQGRGKRLKENQDTFSGLFWSGEQAVSLGLADQFGGVEQLSKKLNLDNEVDYTISDNPFDSLLGRMGSTFGHAAGTALKQELGTDSQTAALQ